MRREFCTKDDILITYDSDTVSFEDIKSADAILISNAGKIIHSNFSDEKNSFFITYFNKIYPAITNCRNLDNLEIA